MRLGVGAGLVLEEEGVLSFGGGRKPPAGMKNFLLISCLLFCATTTRSFARGRAGSGSSRTGVDDRCDCTSSRSAFS